MIKLKYLPKSVISFLFFSAFLFILASCGSTRKLVYFQEGTNRIDSLPLLDPYIPSIQKGDVLSVQVTSLNQQATAYFNPHSSIASSMDNSVSGGSSVTVPKDLGYLVSPEGTIELPLVGKINVLGLTTYQAGEKIKKELSEYLKEPTVNVRNMNFRISVLGEVAKPTMLSIYNEQITLTQALSLAGDITVFGRRDNVMLIREVNGKRTFNRINLGNRDLFASSFYYLRPNDVVYVEPSKAKGTTVDRAFQVLPLILSVASITVFFLLR